MKLDVDTWVQILRYVQARGSDARDLRDATHEAHHAIASGCRKPWTRDNIHAAVLRAARGDRITRLLGGSTNEALVKYELEARAVEWIICERAGLEYDLPKWADVMWWETFKNMNIRLPDVDDVAKAIKLAKERPSIVRAADRVAELADKPLPRGRARRLPTAAEPAR